MLNLSDRVQHKVTGDIGIVIGYGCHLVDNNYFTTVKVRITSSTTAEMLLIVEDLFSKWLFYQEKENDRLCLQSNTKRLYAA